MPGYDADRWAALLNGTSCPMCASTAPSAAAPGLVAELPSGRVILQDDADFRGYCILVFRRHATELHQLSAAERQQLMEDIARTARGIDVVCSPAKLNYAILGNEVPHLHCHVIPRYPDDGYWGAPIWMRPVSARKALASDEFERLTNELSDAIKKAAE